MSSIPGLEEILDHWRNARTSKEKKEKPDDYVILINLGKYTHTHIHSKDYAWFCCMLIRFRTHYPKIWHFGILNICPISWRSLRKWQNQEGHSNITPSFFPETDHKTHMWEVPALSQFSFQTQTGTLRRLRKTFSSPTIVWDWIKNLNIRDRKERKKVNKMGKGENS